MELTENEVNSYKRRISDLKEKIAEKKAKRKFIKIEIDKKKKDLRLLGIKSTDEAKQISNSLERKCKKLKRNIERELDKLEKRIGRHDFRY